MQRRGAYAGDCSDAWGMPDSAIEPAAVPAIAAAVSQLLQRRCHCRRPAGCCINGSRARGMAIQAGGRRRALHPASRRPAGLLPLRRRSTCCRGLRLCPRVILLPAGRLHPVLGGRRAGRHCSGSRLSAAWRPRPPWSCSDGHSLWSACQVLPRIGARHTCTDDRKAPINHLASASGMCAEMTWH